MGKNKRRQFQYFDEFHKKDLLTDSYEECDFLNWCSEAAELGIIIDFEYQPESFVLFEPVFYINPQKKKKSLFRIHAYSADFRIRLNPNTLPVLQDEFKITYDQLQKECIDVFLDVKGTFQRNGMGRSFSINQKWMYEKYGIYIQKLVPQNFFKTCGCPLKSFKSLKSNKMRSIFKGYPTISEIFQSKSS